MTTPDPAAIARSLTPAQRRAVTDPWFRDLAWASTMGLGVQLAELGMVGRPCPSNRRYWYLTPLGRAVRTALARLEGASHD